MTKDQLNSLANAASGMYTECPQPDGSLAIVVEIPLPGRSKPFLMGEVCAPGKSGDPERAMLARTLVKVLRDVAFGVGP